MTHLFDRFLAAFKARRSAAAQAVELAGFGLVTIGVDMVFGRGVALMVAGVFAVLVAAHMGAGR